MVSDNDAPRLRNHDAERRATKFASINLGPHNRFAMFGDHYFDTFAACELECQNLAA